MRRFAAAPDIGFLLQHAGIAVSFWQEAASKPATPAAPKPLPPQRAPPVQAIAPPAPKPKPTPEQKAAMHALFWPNGKKDAYC